MDIQYDIDTSNDCHYQKIFADFCCCGCPHDATKQLDKGFVWQVLGNIEEQKLHVITTALQIVC